METARESQHQSNDFHMSDVVDGRLWLWIWNEDRSECKPIVLDVHDAVEVGAVITQFLDSAVPD